MGILQDIGNLKYHFVLDLIRNEETYDKKKSVVTGLNVFKKCLNRYNLIQQALLPLKNKLGDRVDVTDIAFINSNDDESGIIVKYLKEEKQYFLSLSNIDYEDISVVATDSKIQNSDFIKENRRLILKTFRDITDNYLDDVLVIKSTTGRFIIKDNGDVFIVKDLDEKVFSIETKYSNYEKNECFNNIAKLNCNFPKLNELLNDGGNVLLMLEHMHIYEDNLPKVLTKKLT